MVVLRGRPHVTKDALVFILDMGSQTVKRQNAMITGVAAEIMDVTSHTDNYTVHHCDSDVHDDNYSA